MIRSIMRKARCYHRCGCGTSIRPGDHYNEMVASPDHGDLGNPHWMRLAECIGCANRYGRWSH